MKVARLNGFLAVFGLQLYFGYDSGRVAHVDALVIGRAPKRTVRRKRKPRGGRQLELPLDAPNIKGITIWEGPNVES